MSKVNLSPETVAAVRKYGPAIDKMARKRYGISGAALLGKLVAGESHDSMGAVSGAGARAKAQFMPASRTEAIRRYGVDPWHSTDEAVHGAELHLRGKINGSTGLEGYNPGDPSYTKYILSQKIGDVHGGNVPRRGGGRTPGLPSLAAATSTRASQGGAVSRTKTDLDGAVLDSLLAPHRPGHLSSDIVARLDSGAYTSQSPPNRDASSKMPTTTRGHLGQAGGAAAPYGSVHHLNFVAPQGGVQPVVHQFLHEITRYLGGPVDVGTGKEGHSILTVNGRRSDHADGYANDLPATGHRGDQIAYAAFRAAGVPKGQAHDWAHAGGLHNIIHNGHRIQIIWKTMIGGNHFTHVHVGIKPLH